MKFTKILIGRNSPKNKCYADEGEPLIIAQDSHKMKGKLPQGHHFFLGTQSSKPSRYGWVQIHQDGISPTELAEYFQLAPSQELVDSCQLLLDSIKNLNEGDPVACTFSVVGIIEKKRVLKVHKIFFQSNRK